MKIVLWDDRKDRHDRLGDLKKELGEGFSIFPEPSSNLEDAGEWKTYCSAAFNADAIWSHFAGDDATVFLMDLRIRRDEFPDLDTYNQYLAMHDEISDRLHSCSSDNPWAEEVLGKMSDLEAKSPDLYNLYQDPEFRGSILLIACAMQRRADVIIISTAAVDHYSCLESVFPGVELCPIDHRTAEHERWEKAILGKIIDPDPLINGILSAYWNSKSLDRWHHDPTEDATAKSEPVIDTCGLISQGDGDIWGNALKGLFQYYHQGNRLTVPTKKSISREYVEQLWNKLDLPPLTLTALSCQTPFPPGIVFFLGLRQLITALHVGNRSHPNLNIVWSELEMNDCNYYSLKVDGISNFYGNRTAYRFGEKSEMFTRKPGGGLSEVVWNLCHGRLTSSENGKMVTELMPLFDCDSASPFYAFPYFADGAIEILWN